MIELLNDFLSRLKREEVIVFLRNFLKNFKQGAYLVDEKRKILFWNKSAEKISGFKAREVTGSHCYQNILQHIDHLGRKLCLHDCPLHKTMNDGKIRQANVFLYHKDGTRIPVAIQTFPIKAKSKSIGALELFSSSGEISKLKNELSRAKKLSFFDSLTAVGNRRLLEDALKIAFSELKRFGQPFAVHLIDFDNFKMINDTYGHLTGDSVLKQIAKTISFNIRTVDIFGRWGGDEFLLIQKRATKKTMLELASKLENIVAGSKLPQFPKIALSISIGSYLIKSSDSVKSALEKADKNLYLRKQLKRN